MPADIEVVDDDLANEKYRCLNAFADGQVQTKLGFRPSQFARRTGQEVRHNDGRHYRRDDSRHPIPHVDEHQRADQLYDNFQHVVDSQMKEVIHALHQAAPDSQRHIERSADAQQHHVISSGKIQISGKHAAGNHKEHAYANAP